MFNGRVRRLQREMAALHEGILNPTRLVEQEGSDDAPDVPASALTRKRGEAPLPEPWAALYVEPLPDGARRNCSGCFLWIRPLAKCVIHSKDIEVDGDMICGYHVAGQPQTEWLDHPALVVVKPEFSGLSRIPGGTSCDNCKYFQWLKRDSGLCHGLAIDDRPVNVKRRSCCSRWEANAELERELDER